MYKKIHDNFSIIAGIILIQFYLYFYHWFMMYYIIGNYPVVSEIPNLPEVKGIPRHTHIVYIKLYTYNIWVTLMSLIIIISHTYCRIQLVLYDEYDLFYLRRFKKDKYVWKELDTLIRSEWGIWFLTLLMLSHCYSVMVINNLIINNAAEIHHIGMYTLFECKICVTFFFETIIPFIKSTKVCAWILSYFINK